MRSRGPAAQGRGPLFLDEQALTERLIAYDTSTPDGIKKAAGFVKGWLESRDIPVEELDVRGHAAAGRLGRARQAARRVVLHGHLDVVPAREEQFTPRVEGDRLYGRGAYDMKGALAAMMGAVQELRDAARRAASCFAVVPDEESEEEVDRGTERPDPQRLYRATSRSPGSPPTSTSASRRRACSRCGSRWRARPRTGRRRGSATTRSSRRSTPSARSSRCRSRARARTCSTGPRSTSAGSSAATRSTRSRTRA